MFRFRLFKKLECLVLCMYESHFHCLLWMYVMKRSIQMAEAEKSRELKQNSKVLCAYVIFLILRKIVLLYYSLILQLKIYCTESPSLSSVLVAICWKPWDQVLHLYIISTIR